MVDRHEQTESIVSNTIHTLQSLQLFPHLGRRLSGRGIHNDVVVFLLTIFALLWVRKMTGKGDRIQHVFISRHARNPYNKMLISRRKRS